MSNKESLSSLGGVVIEQINLCRLDLDKVQRLYTNKSLIWTTPQSSQTLFSHALQ
jgi:hypothetical protein